MAALADVPANYTLKNTGVFLQDSWAINYNLTLMFGVRVDMPDFSDQKLFNPLVQQTLRLRQHQHGATTS